VKPHAFDDIHPVTAMTRFGGKQDGKGRLTLGAVWGRAAMTSEETFPAGWDAERVRRLVAHYDALDEEQHVAEDEAAAGSDSSPIGVPQAKEGLATGENPPAAAPPR
jgi:hypothetical protein